MLKLKNADHPIQGKSMKTTLDKPQLEAAINKILDLAAKQGATAAEAAASTSSGFSATVRMGQVETIEHDRDKEIDVTVYFDHKTGSASTSDFTEDALRLTVEKACTIAKFTGEDPYSGLADKTLMAFGYPDLQLYHPWNISTEQAIAQALECETIARAEDKRISNSEGATVNTHQYFSIYGNSNGFLGSFPMTQHTVSCAVIANDGHEMQRDYDYTVACNPQDLVDLSVLAKKVAQRTVRRLGAKSLSTRECPVLFAPQMARGLIKGLIGAISGPSLYRNASFLLNQIEKKVFPEFIHIAEHPHLLNSLSSAPFDDEGVFTRDKDIISNGILKSYILGSYSARKLGLQTTGNAGGVHNVIINSTGQDFSDLLKQMGTGLLVTELIGQGINIVTGDYSRGAFGYWVEHGEIQYPVQEITVAGNLKDMFLNIVAVGNDVDRRGNVHTGSILIDRMMVAGQ